MLDHLLAFHFIRPAWLFALPLVGIALWALNRVQRQGDQWTSLINPALLPHLLDGKQRASSRNHTPWLLVPLVLGVLALAGPAWQKLPQPLERNGSALVILWDLSPSVLAQDTKPSRLERGRLKIIDLLKARKDGQTALIAYSGQAHVVAPLTEDIETIINLLPSLSPMHLPTVGSNPEMALQHAQKLLEASGINRGDILFLTDGIDPTAFDSLNQTLSKRNNYLTVWGIGTDIGSPIPLPQGGFVKDKGNLVQAKLNSGELRQWANQQQGYFLAVQNTDADIKTLSQRFNRTNTSLTQTNRQFDQWFEAGQYLCLALLPLCLVLFRRGWLLMLVLALPLSPTPSQAQPSAHLTPPPATAQAAPAETQPRSLPCANSGRMLGTQGTNRAPSSYKAASRKQPPPRSTAPPGALPPNTKAKTSRPQHKAFSR